MHKLLVVDDEAVPRQFVEFLVEEQNLPVRVYAASSGKEALRKMSKDLPELVLLDIKMPEMDGITAAGLIRERYPWVPIVFLTAYDDFSYVRSALRLGAHDYLLKPLTPESCMKILKTYLLTENRGASLIRFSIAGDVEHTGLIEAVLTGEKEKAHRFFDELFKMKETLPASPSSWRMFAVELAGQIRRAGSGGKFYTPEQLHKIISWERKFESLSSVEEVLPLLKRFLTELLNTYADTRISSQEKRIREAAVYIETHAERKLTLPDIASRFGFSRSHFSRLFRQYTGQGFSLYLKKARVEKAKVYLRDTDETLFAISREVGYEDPGHLSSVFLEITGIRPTVFRKQHRT